MSLLSFTLSLSLSLSLSGPRVCLTIHTNLLDLQRTRKKHSSSCLQVESLLFLLMGSPSQALALGLEAGELAL
jgi:hypothetical protein